MRALDWDEDPQLLAAWQEGRTGYPLVDAGMRQLRASGWMHNRARLVVGSFLTKDLQLDWRAGEAWFMRWLLDGDVAQNNGNWQWIASVGVDPAPAFRRLLNPALQQRRHDPDGAYVRRWVPELRDVPDARLAEPWRMSAEEQAAAGCAIGRDYPAPVVDHAQERRRALARYRAAGVRRARRLTRPGTVRRHARELRDGARERRLARVAEAEHEARRDGRAGRDAEPRQPVQAHAARGGGREERRLVDRLRQQRDDVQPGGDPVAEPPARQLARERRDQRVAPRAVARAHAPQVAVELAALEEVGERELVEHGRAEVVERLLHRDRAGRAPAAARASRAAAPGASSLLAQPA